MATSHQIIGAASDGELLQRGIALGASLGIDQFVVERNWRQVVATEITGQTSVAVVYDYAFQVRKELVEDLPPSPGMNPAAVLDSMLLEALAILIPAEEG